MFGWLKSSSPTIIKLCTVNQGREFNYNFANNLALVCPVCVTQLLLSRSWIGGMKLCIFVKKNSRLPDIVDFIIFLISVRLVEIFQKAQFHF